MTGYNAVSTCEQDCVTNCQKMHRAGWTMSKRTCAQSRECAYSHQEAEVTGEDEVTSVEWITRAHRVEVGNECAWDNKSAWLNDHARGKECAKNKEYTGVKNTVIEHSKHWGTIAMRCEQGKSMQQAEC